MDIDNLINEIKEKLYELQTAFDESELSEEAGACYPVEEWLKMILAAYSEKTGDNTDIPETPKPEGNPEPEGKPEPEAHGEGENNEGDGTDLTESSDKPDWLSENYWTKRVIQQSDKDNSKKGYNPNTCSFWIPSNGKDLYGFNGYVESDKNIINIIKKVAYMFDYGSSSFKEFNNIHLHNGDRNFTIGYQHLAGSNERDFFIEKIINNPNGVFDEMCKYIVYRLIKDNILYRIQAANDPVIKPFLFKNVSGQIDEQLVKTITRDQWLSAIKFFFSKKGVLKTGNVAAYISNHEKVSHFNLWAEKEMIRYYDPDNYKLLDPKYRKDKYKIQYREAPPDVEGSRLTTETITDKDGNEITYKYITVIPLFNTGKNPNEHHTGFWFYEIVKDALLIKTVAAEQIKYWLDAFYTKKIIPKMKNDLGIDDSFFQRDFTTDITLITGVLAYSALANNAFGSKFSPHDKDDLVATYKTKKVEIKKSQYSSSESEPSADDKLEAMIFLRGIMYKIEHPKRSRTDCLLKEYWNKMYGLIKKDGTVKPITSMPGVTNAKNIRRLKKEV